VEGQSRVHGRHHLVEVVLIGLDELPSRKSGRDVAGWPLKSAITPTTNGSSFISIASPASTS
jgi:hypothetical protein